MQGCYDQEQIGKQSGGGKTKKKMVEEKQQLVTKPTFEPVIESFKLEDVEEADDDLKNKKIINEGDEEIKEKEEKEKEIEKEKKWENRKRKGEGRRKKEKQEWDFKGEEERNHSSWRQGSTISFGTFQEG